MHEQKIITTFLRLNCSIERAKAARKLKVDSNSVTLDNCRPKAPEFEEFCQVGGATNSTDVQSRVNNEVDRCSRAGRTDVKLTRGFSRTSSLVADFTLVKRTRYQRSYHHVMNFESGRNSSPLNRHIF